MVETQKETLTRNSAFTKSVREVIGYQSFEESAHEDSLVCHCSNGERPVLAPTDDFVVADGTEEEFYEILF